MLTVIMYCYSKNKMFTTYNRSRSEQRTTTKISNYNSNNNDNNNGNKSNNSNNNYYNNSKFITGCNTTNWYDIRAK